MHRQCYKFNSLGLLTKRTSSGTDLRHAAAPDNTAGKQKAAVLHEWCSLSLSSLGATQVKPGHFKMQVYLSQAACDKGASWPTNTLFEV